MENTTWTAIGAIGQVLGAIATFCAVIVALRPYRKKVVVRLRSVFASIGKEKTALSIYVCVKNDGAKPITVQKIGIKEKYETIIIEGEFLIEDEDQASFKITQEQLHDSFYNGQKGYFSVFVYDSKGNYYFSKKYPKCKFTKNESISELFT